MHFLKMILLKGKLMGITFDVGRVTVYALQARQTRPNSGGVAEGHPRFDKGGVAIIF